MSQKSDKRVCVISLDGVPGSLLAQAFGEGWGGGLGTLWNQGGVAQLRSTVPPLSSVAWATYTTGTQPGHHGVYGFVDRHPETMSRRLLTADDIHGSSLWELLGQHGDRSVILNLPLTWPAKAFPGWLIAGFPAPDLERAVHPRALLSRLTADDYVVDPDPALAAQPPAFFAQLHKVLEDRRRLAMAFVDHPWKLFHLHIMATDRLHHFFFSSRKTGGPHHEAFRRVYAHVGEVVTEIAAALPGDSELVLMSDHGFGEIAWELDINALLIDQGFLVLQEGPEGPSRVAASSKGYAQTPGRVYLMRRGRERDGWLTPTEAQREGDRIAKLLLETRRPDGQLAIHDVHRGAELYHGPCAENAPDLVALPAPGVELTAGWSDGDLWHPARRSGGHTLEGAFLWVRDHCPRDGTVEDVPATLWSLLRREKPQQFTGKALVEA